jgi:hypothetical protein
MSALALALFRHGMCSVSGQPDIGMCSCQWLNLDVYFERMWTYCLEHAPWCGSEILILEKQNKTITKNQDQSADGEDLGAVLSRISLCRWQLLYHFLTASVSCECWCLPCKVGSNNQFHSLSRAERSQECHVPWPGFWKLNCFDISEDGLLQIFMRSVETLSGSCWQ